MFGHDAKVDSVGNFIFSHTLNLMLYKKKELITILLQSLQLILGNLPQRDHSTTEIQSR